MELCGLENIFGFEVESNDTWKDIAIVSNRFVTLKVFHSTEVDKEPATTPDGITIRGEFNYYADTTIRNTESIEVLIHDDVYVGIKLSDAIIKDLQKLISVYVAKKEYLENK